MLTVMIINNFTEIKGSVFKKFDKHNLFQLACSDVTERFELFLFMMIIVFVGLAQAGDSWFESIPSFVQIIVTMITCEAFADWIKHAFIIKTNQLDPYLYTDYARILRSDVLNYQDDKIILERTYGIARRVGLPQIPLTCVCFRYVNLMISTPTVSKYFHGLSNYQIIWICFMIYVMLFAIKINIGLSLIFYAGKIHNDEQKECHQDEAETAEKKQALNEKKLSLPALLVMPPEAEAEIHSTDDIKNKKCMSPMSRESFSLLTEIERHTALNGRVDREL